MSDFHKEHEWFSKGNLNNLCCRSTEDSPKIVF